MSITRNRELSQFGSFIYIDDNTQNIGITSGSTPFVGIGTTIPSVKFEVVGDTNIVGTLEATSYTLNGTPLINAALAQWTYATGDIDVYRLNGNVAIGTSVFTEKLTVNGNVSAGQFISTVTSGTPPLIVLSDTQVTNLNASFLRGKVPPGGTIVGTTDVQTLTNKTLTSPIINGGSLSSSGITFNGATSGTTILQASAVASGTITLPAITTTLVGKDTLDILTNKTISSSSNTIIGITSSNLSSSAGILNTQLLNSTISGVSLGNNLNSLSFGSYLTSTGSYDGSIVRTVSVAGTSINTGNTLVARDISGDFTAGTVSVTNLIASQTITVQNIIASDGLSVTGNLNISGIVTCTDLNSTSDINLKENIQPIKNALDTVNSLRGVSFDWKKTGSNSYGVIAQELEEILPALVNGNEVKSVNYNGLVGILIEAIKELSEEIKDLKSKMS